MRPCVRCGWRFDVKTPSDMTRCPRSQKEIEAQQTFQREYALMVLLFGGGLCALGIGLVLALMTLLWRRCYER